MSLTLALNNALTGLNVNQRTMAVISNNIANANTEGYSRQVVDLASVTYDGTGQGVRVKDVVRKIDEYLENAITRQTAVVGYSDITNEFMERSQILLGDPSNQSSIDAQIETFFNNLQAMAETPERTSTRAAVVEAGVNLSREMSNLAYNFEQLRFQADTEISQGIDVINAALKKIYTINEAISNADAFGTSKAALFDQQDMALNDLAEYVDIRTYRRENGAVHVYVGQGIPLVDDVVYALEYKKIGALDVLTDEGQINPINLWQLTAGGARTGSPIELVSAGVNGEDISRLFTSGKLGGLLDIRDTVFPNMLEQLDMLASTLRDTVNALHNQGTGYPSASELTGTRAVSGGDRSAWTGSVRIAILDKTGQPAPSVYADEESAFRPLTLDLDTLFNGVTTGEPDVQMIIDEINNHFGIPQNRFALGNFNQIQLALSSDRTPGNTNSIVMDFDIENISGQDGDFWVNNVQILDDMGADITSTTNTLPSVALDAVNTFTTTLNSNLVEIRTAANHTLRVGDRIYLNDPGVPVNGILGSAFNDYFEIEDITNNSFFIRLPTPATAAGVVGVAAQSAFPPYTTVVAGDKDRTRDSGTITASLAGNTGSSYYDVRVTMAVRDEDGNLSSSIVTYRLEAPEINTRNDRISARAITSGGGSLVIPETTQGYLRAMLVDENGDELPKVNGEYGDQEGYLRIVSLNSLYTVAIDELDSKQIGLPNDVPPQDGTNRAFSHYFELNNFFRSNEPTQTGDKLKNSALNMEVESRLQRNPTLISTGKLVLSRQPVDPEADPFYTYERYSGDNDLAQAFAKLGISAFTFTAAGGLPDATLSFNGYASEMLGYMTTTAVSAAARLSNDETLMKGYQERADAISGVNLDEELANTIIYQNAYTASAKVITVTNELFDALLQAV
jgi:flagellar hook-associated protein FlgK